MKSVLGQFMDDIYDSAKLGLTIVADNRIFGEEELQDIKFHVTMPDMSTQTALIERSGDNYSFTYNAQKMPINAAAFDFFIELIVKCGKTAKLC